jgi:hypothetical protein
MLPSRAKQTSAIGRRQYLEGKTVVGMFSLGQWAQLVAGVVLGLGFGV